MKNRIRWVDSARFLGIFAIYLGHFGTKAGNSYGFVFQYHVAFFIFLSGCMSNYDTETNLIRFLGKKVKGILLPLWVFSILSIFIYMIQNNIGLNAIKDYLPLIIKGNIRNTFFAESLWFLSCLFVVEIFFKVFKFLRIKGLIFIICLGMYIIAEKVISPHPLVEPHWCYNIDSAFYYIIFFVIGYMAYPYIMDLFDLDSGWKWGIFIIAGGLSLVYSGLLFGGRDCLEHIISMFPFLSFFAAIFRALLIIWLNLTVAKVIENIKLFNEIGQNTLYLCGNEYIIKMLFPCLVSIVGLEISLLSPLTTYLYTMILLVVGLKIVVMFEKRLLYSIMKVIKREDLED